MFEVIKGSNPFKNVVIEGEAVISNKIAGEEEKAGDGLDETESPEEGANGEDGEEKQSPPKINYAELEDLREQYRREGQEYAVAMHKRADGEFEKARAEAEKIVEEAKEKGRRLLKQIDEKSEATYDEARKKGIDEGFEEGLKKGQEEGYVQGLKKCKEALMELKQLCENVEREKADIMAENRRGIFDLAMKRLGEDDCRRRQGVQKRQKHSRYPFKARCKRKYGGGLPDLRKVLCSHDQCGV